MKLTTLPQNESVRMHLRNSANFDNLGNLYISCPTHPAYFITNMCINQKCIEPLCQECINLHLDYHNKSKSTGQVFNIQMIRKQQLDAAASNLATLLKDLDQLNSHSLQSNTKDNFLTLSLTQLENAKQRVLQIVNEVFTSHEQAIKSQLNSIGKLQEEFDKVKQDIEQKIQKMEKLIADLQSSEYLQPIIYSLTRNIANKKQFTNDVEGEIQHFESQLPEISIQKSYEEQFHSALTKYIKFNKKIFKEKAEDPNTSSKKKKKGVQFAKQQKVHTEDDEEIVLVTEEDDENKEEDTKLPKFPKMDFSDNAIQPHFHNQKQFSITPIEIKNFQSPQGFICSLFDDEKKFGYFSFFQKGQPKIIVESLFVENRLPCNHQLIQDEQGQILLLGGIIKDVDRNVATSQVFKVNLQQRTLNKHSNMLTRRQDFGACLVGNFIFVCGGSTSDNEEDAINNLERMDTHTGRWIPLSPAKTKSSGCTLVNFSNQYLMKIGGIDEKNQEIKHKIELYNIKRDIWTEITVKDSHGNPWRESGIRQGAVQVNEHEVLIFGGETQDNYKDDSWVLKFEENLKNCKASRFYSLPYGGSVKEPIIVMNKCIYLTVNYITQIGNIKRLLIVGKKDGWQELN